MAGQGRCGVGNYHWKIQWHEHLHLLTPFSTLCPGGFGFRVLDVRAYPLFSPLWGPLGVCLNTISSHRFGSKRCWKKSVSDEGRCGRGRRAVIGLLEGLQKPCGCSRVDQEEFIPPVAFGVDSSGANCGNLAERLPSSIHLKEERDTEIEIALCNSSIC